MIVKLFNCTPKVLETLYTAANSCYSDRSPEDIFNNGPILTDKEMQAVIEDWTTCGNEVFALFSKQKQKMLKTVRGCIVRNHNTVLRHVNFTFSIKDISIVCARQFMRMQAGIVYDEQSARYCEKKDINYVLPKSLKNLCENANTEDPDDLGEEICRLIETTKDLYARLIKSGIPKEDARFVLLLALPTQMTCTINLAALFHLHNIRVKMTTGKSQDEVSVLAQAMVDEVVKKEKWLGEFFK